MPQEKLLQYLTGISNELKPNETPGMDCSVVATRHKGLFFVSTTDFFYPNVEDPYSQGRIAACNVLSDLYAVGIVDVDTVLMILAVSMDMAAEERDACTAAMIRGFNDTCREAGTSCTGGQTVQNPWPIVGGVASSTCTEEELIRPEGAQVGDVLVLTKPLGTQVAVNTWQWRDGRRHWPKLVEAGVMDPDRAAAAFDTATRSMGRLNRNAARMMHEYAAHGATDVTGFGLLGHADNLCKHSAQKLIFDIYTLPIIRDMLAVDTCIGGNFKLKLGRSAETSGGLLLAIPKDRAEGFIQAVKGLDGADAWIIGDVLAVDEAASQQAGAVIRADATVIEV